MSPTSEVTDRRHRRSPADVLIWLSANLMLQEGRNRSRERSPILVYAHLIDLGTTAVRLDVRASYTLHHDRCRLGYCGEVTEWVGYHICDKGDWEALLESGEVIVDNTGRVYLT